MTETTAQPRFPERLVHVARAICTAYGSNYDEQAEYGIGLPAHHPELPSRADFREMARAALEAEGIIIDD